MNRRSGSSRRGRRRGQRTGGVTGDRPAASSRSDTASTSVAEAGEVAEVSADVTDTVKSDAAAEVTEVAEPEPVAAEPVAEPETPETPEAAEAPEPEVAKAPEVPEPAEAAEAPEPEAAEPEVAEAPETEPAPAAAMPEPAPTEPAEPPVELEHGELGDKEYDEYEAEDTSSWVRPYVWTGGRTDTSLDFALETLVSARKALAQPDEAMRDEHRRVLELCDKPRSVTEIAALLSVPLGVAKTLLGAMAEEDMLVVHRDGRTGPDLALMERVLRGLKNL